MKFQFIVYFSEQRRIKVTYFAKYPTVIHSFIMSFMLIQGIYQLWNGNGGRGFFQCTIGIILLLSYFIRYQIVFRHSTIAYNVTFLGKVLISKRIEAATICKLTFKRVGWSSRGAFIHTKKLLPIRLINFQPEEMYEYLYSFGRKHHIPIFMKEDYKVLNRELTKES
jgi:hypothetical protein